MGLQRLTCGGRVVVSMKSQCVFSCLARGPLADLGPLGSSSSQHRQTLELVLQNGLSSPTLEVTQGQILSQSPTDATSSR